MSFSSSSFRGQSSSLTYCLKGELFIHHLLLNDQLVDLIFHSSDGLTLSIQSNLLATQNYKGIRYTLQEKSSVECNAIYVEWKHNHYTFAMVLFIFFLLLSQRKLFKLFQSIEESPINQDGHIVTSS